MAKTAAGDKHGKDSREVRKAREFGVGLPARRAAAGLLHAVLADGQPLDDALVNSTASRIMISMAARDRALARAIASTSLRRKGQIDDVLKHFLDRPLPKKSGMLREILLSGACQILFLDTPNHATIDLAVTLTKQTRQTRHFDKLVNAVLRRVAEKGPDIIAKQDAAQLNTPPWLWERWSNIYGTQTAERIAAAHMGEAALDLSVKSEAEEWARKFNGLVTPTGSVRLKAGGRVDDMEGFSDGDWWVQDAAAALPAQLLGMLNGKDVADLCAAPGGKTAQLVMAGAHVTAVDSSSARLERLRENLARLKLDAGVVAADAGNWMPGKQFDAVLLDAPCTGTGTLRRHPDIALLKKPKDLEELTGIQARLLAHAATLVRPGGTLLYCTCSLEPEEGENQIARLLEDNPHIKPDRIKPEEIGGNDTWLNGMGQLRTLPFLLEFEDRALSGIDGFFAARLQVGEKA